MANNQEQAAFGDITSGIKIIESAGKSLCRTHKLKSTIHNLTAPEAAMNPHTALDLARAMVTVSPAYRTA